MSISLGRAFFKQALLDTIVPEDTTGNISDLLTQVDDVSGGSAKTSDLLRSQQRKLLFFDEELTIYVGLQIPNVSEDELKLIVDRLDLKVAVWAFDQPDDTGHNVSGEAPTNPANDLIFSASVSKPDDPIVLLRSNEEAGDGRVSLLVLFETVVFLKRPRTRLQVPTISIVPSATIRSEKSDQKPAVEQYLLSFQPLEANVLEPLRNISGVESDPPYLPVSRLQRVLPQLPVDEDVVGIRSAPLANFPILPAVSARLRFNRVPSQDEAKTFASVDFEVNPLMPLLVSLEAVDVSLTHGKVNELMPMELPMKCRSRDCITFMYAVLPKRVKPTVVRPAQTSVLLISIQARVHLSPTSTPTIHLTWSTPVDFPPPARSSPHTLRPSSLPLEPNKNPITISFTAPTAPIHPHQPFTWTILVVNHTPHPIKLSLIPIPRIPLPSSSSTQPQTHQPQNGEKDIAPAILDESTLYSLQHSSIMQRETDLISTTAELRVGPLAPGRCHEARMGFIAFRTGRLRIDALQVVDLLAAEREGGGNGGTGGIGTLIRDLPDVVVVDDEGQGSE